ncbi:Tetratricopeptide repeat protein 16 [Rhizophlyctis rosea]|nr:Tetratricopeptide repeat protein 16 [Rhizophlyctis rosea]
MVPGISDCDLIVTFDGWRHHTNDQPKSGRVSAETGRNYTLYIQKATELLLNRLPDTSTPLSTNPSNLIPAPSALNHHIVPPGRADTVGLVDFEPVDPVPAGSSRIDQLIASNLPSPDPAPRFHRNYVIATHTDHIRSGPQTRALAQITSALSVSAPSKVPSRPPSNATPDTTNASSVHQTRLRIVTLSDRLGFALCVRTALSYVHTPYVLIIQHDWQFVEPLDLLSILKTMERHHEEVKYVGFISARIAEYAEKKGKGRGLPPSAVEDGRFDIPLARLFFWFDKVEGVLRSSTDHYRNFVFSQNRFQRGDFIEDTFGQFQLGDIKRPTPEEGIEVHKKYATWLYYPDNGRTSHLFHLNGRKFLTDHGKKIYEERQRGADVRWKGRTGGKEESGDVERADGAETGVELDGFFVDDLQDVLASANLRGLQTLHTTTRPIPNPSTATADFTRAIYLQSLEPSYHLHRAQSYLQALDFPAAIASYRQCVVCVREMNERESMMRRGLEVLSGEGDGDVEDVENRWPSRWVVTKLMGPGIYTWGQILLDERRFGEALEAFKTAMDCEMNRESVLVRMALAHIGLEQYDEALEILYVLTTEISGSNVDYYILRAKIYQQLDNVEFANIDYTTAKHLNPSHPELTGLSKYVHSTAVGYKNKASEQILKGQLGNAVHFLNHAVELHPGDWVVRLKRGATLAELRQYDGAVEDFREVLTSEGFDKDREEEVKRHLASVYNRMGVDAARSGNHTWAVKCFTTALEWNAHEGTIYRNRAECHEALDNIDDCLGDLAMVLKLDPRDDETGQKCGELWFEIGEQAFGEGDWRDAVGAWTQAIHFDPTVPEYFFRRAKAFYLLEKLDEARHDAQMAIRLDATHHEAQALFAELTTGAPPFEDLHPFPPQRRVKTAVPIGVLPAGGSGLIDPDVDT